MKLREALLIGLELIDGGALILQTLLKRLRWRILKPQHVVFLFPARELFTKFRIVQKRQIVLKPLLLQFGGVSGFLCLGRLFQGQPNEAALCI